MVDQLQLVDNSASGYGIRVVLPFLCLWRSWCSSAWCVFHSCISRLLLSMVQEAQEGIRHTLGLLWLRIHMRSFHPHSIGWNKTHRTAPSQRVGKYTLLTKPCQSVDAGRVQNGGKPCNVSPLKHKLPQLCVFIFPFFTLFSVHSKSFCSSLWAFSPFAGLPFPSCPLTVRAEPHV